jgi:hypothetical protein
MLTKFTGFKGVCVFAQIGDVQFAMIAQNKRDLEALWNHIMPEAGPLDPAGTKKAILIEASLLTPKAEARITIKAISQDTPTIEV